MKRSYAPSHAGAKKKKFVPFKKGSFKPKFNAFYGPRIGLSRGKGELKVCDVSSDDSSITLLNSGSMSATVDNTTGAATHQVAVLNSMAQGTDFTGRVGRKIRPMSLLVDLVISPLTTASSPHGEIIRMIIFWDMQSNGATTFPITNLLQDYSAAPSVSVTTPINLNNRDRFKILWDKRFRMCADAYSAGALTTGDPCPINVKKYIKLGQVATTFNATGSGVYGDIQSGALLMTIFAENGGVTNYTYTSRCRFVDE